MIHKASTLRTWQQYKGDSHHWVLCTNSGEQIAEVQCDADGTWQWWRTTTMAEHGVPPGYGREPSRREAQRRAVAGLA